MTRLFRWDMIGRGPALALALAVATLGSAAAARAAQPPEPVFGLIGIARGETARLNLVLCDGSVRLGDGSVRPGDGSVRLCDGSVVPAEAATCTVSLGFADPAGEPIHDRSGRAVTVTRVLRPGVGMSLDLSASEALTAGRLRRSFRPVVRVSFEPPDPDTIPPDPIAPNPCAGLVPTVEVIDAVTGRTSFVYAPPPVTQIPPEPVHR
jgi:hypothetical protein